MIDLLFIHILLAILLFAGIATRLISAFLGKKLAGLRSATYILTALQILSGVGLIFNGASLARVCLPGLALVAVVVVSDFALNRGIFYDRKSNQ